MGRQIQDDFRLDIPTVFGPLNRGRRILWITFGGSAVRPFHEGVNLTLLQRTIVREMPITRVSGPRRHFPRRHSGFDRFCPGTRLLITKERHRGDLAWSMTALTVFLQNGKYVLRKSNGRGLFGCYGGHRQPCKNQRHHNLASFPAKPAFPSGLLSYVTTD